MILTANLDLSNIFSTTLVQNAPTVVSILPKNLVVQPINALPVSYVVTFSEGVTGVDASDFKIAEIVAATVVSVTEIDGANYEVLVDITGQVDTELYLSLDDDNSILSDTTGLLLGGEQLGDGSAQSSQSHRVDTIPPQVNSIRIASPSPSMGNAHTFEVIFSEEVSGLDPTDFLLNAIPGGMTVDNVVRIAGDQYRVDVSTTKLGVLKLELSDNDSIIDLAGNPLGGLGIGNGNFFTGEVIQLPGWQLEAYIKAANSGPGDRFSLGPQGISFYQDTLAVGARYEDSDVTVVLDGNNAPNNNDALESGAVYVYQRTSDGYSWDQQAYFKANNAQVSDEFGSSVSLWGDLLAVGTLSEDNSVTTVVSGGSVGGTNTGPDAGAVYLYERLGQSWSLKSYFKPETADDGDQYSYSISLKGSAMAVGMPREGSDETTILNTEPISASNAAPDSGAVYLYEKSGSIWSRTGYFKAGNNQLSTAMGFGFRVVLEGDYLFVSAPFEDSNQKTITNGTFSSPNASLPDSGAVFVYHRTGGMWQQEAYIKAPNSSASDDFGRTLAYSSGFLAVGAQHEDSNQTGILNAATLPSFDDSSSNTGAVYVFERDAAGLWGDHSFIKMPVDTTSTDQFGFGLALDGDSLAIGAPQEDSSETGIISGSAGPANNISNNSGSVFVYEKVGGSWEQVAYIKPPIAADDDRFGSEVFLSGDTLVVATPNDDSGSTIINYDDASVPTDYSALNSGAVYVYRNKGKAFEPASPAIEKLSPTNLKVTWADNTGAVSQYRVVWTTGTTPPSANCGSGTVAFTGAGREVPISPPPGQEVIFRLCSLLPNSTNQYSEGVLIYSNSF